MICADDAEDSRTLRSGDAKSTRAGAGVPTDKVIADFEEAPIAAICAVFGNVVAVSGCWFHFAQVLVKPIRK